MLNRIFCFLLLFIGSNLFGQVQTYTLQQCIETALANNFEVKQAAINLAQATSQVRTEKLGQLPSANLSASHAYNLGRSIDRATNSFVNSRVRNNFFGLNTDVVLFNGLQKANTINAREYNAEAALKTLEQSKNQISLQIADLFLRYKLAEENINVVQNQLTQTQGQLARVKKLYEAGSVDQGQVFNLQSQEANDKLNLVNAQNAKETVKVNLRLLLMIDQAQEFTLVLNNELDTTPLVITDAQLIYNTAVTTLPEIAAAEAQLNAGQMTYKAANGGRYPVVSAYANLNTVYSTNAFEIVDTKISSQQIGVVDGTLSPVIGPKFDFVTATPAFGNQLENNFGQSVGLQMNIPLFNGNAVNNNILNAKTNLELSELNLKRVKQQLFNDIQLAINDANAAYQKFQATEISLKAQQLSEDFATKRYNAGLLNFYDYSNARTLYVSALSNYQAAKYEFLFRKMVVEFYRENTWKL